MKYKRIILLILITLIYFGNYHICQYFYPGDSQDSINDWYNLKMANYNIVIVLSIYLASLKPTKDDLINIIEFFTMSVLSSIIISNIIDRLFFDSRFYEWNDLFIIIGAIIISLFESRKRWLNVK